MTVDPADKEIVRKNLADFESKLTEAEKRWAEGDGSF